MDLAVFQQLGVAILLGALIGLEREQKSQRENFSNFGGIRTFALIGFSGALAYLLRDISEYFLILITSGFFLLLITSYLVISYKTKKWGLTTEIAAILVFITGILSAREEYVLAIVVALVTFTVVYFKKFIHRWVSSVKHAEVVSTIQFVIVAFVVLPILPNEGYGPFGFFNPYIVWLMVVFISGISYLSYIAIRVFGTKKGIGVTGFLAGLISSTALALSFSSHSKKHKKVVNPYVVAVVIASSAMFLRVLVEVLVLNPVLVVGLLVPMLTMATVGFVSALFFWFRKDKDVKSIEKKGVEVKSPFALWPAVKFGVVFAVILLLSSAGNFYYGDRGVYLTSFLSGILDVDAITVSMANLAKEGISESLAVRAITIAAMTNTAVKAGIFMLFGSRKVAARILLVIVLMLLAGGASLLIKI